MNMPTFFFQAKKSKLKPILPKAACYCYICDSIVKTPYKLVEFSKMSDGEVINIPSKIGKILGDRYMVVITDDDVMCEKCYFLIIQMTKLEKELKTIKLGLRNLMCAKYKIDNDVSKVKEDVSLESIIAGAVKGTKVLSNLRPVKAKSPSCYSCNMCHLVFETQKNVREHKIMAHLSSWTCHFCDSVFNTQTEYTEHVKAHLNESVSSEESNALVSTPVDPDQQLPENDSIFACDLCGLEFVEKDSFVEHVQTHEAEALPNLDLTNLVKQGGLSLDVFENHEPVEFMDMFNPPINKFQCVYCSIELATLEEMNVHQIEHKFHSDAPETLDMEVKQQNIEANDVEPAALEEIESISSFQCSFCSVSFDSQNALNSHIQTCGSLCENIDEPIEEEVKHDVPLVANQSNSVLEDPLLVISASYTDKAHHPTTPPAPEVKKLRCLACNTTFPSKAALYAHELEMPEHFELGCPDCTLRFPRERNLNEHREMSHADSVHCRMCSKLFHNIKQVKAHEFRHKQSRKQSIFPCTDCDRVFQTATGLRGHRINHTGNFKHKCEFCNKGFDSRVRAEEHRACHTREERFQCDICQKKFVTQGTYWIHRKWHENPKPYKCEVCQRLFKHSSLLAVHRRKHTGERPYKCPYCDQSFTVGNTLKRHISLHTGKFQYNCGVCGVGVSAKHKLAEHMSKVHQDNSLLYQQELAKKARPLYKMVIQEFPADNLETEDPLEANEAWSLDGQTADGKYFALEAATEDQPQMQPESTYSQDTDEANFLSLRGTEDSQCQYLSFRTEQGEEILLTTDLVSQDKDNELVKIVLKDGQIARFAE